MPRTDNEGNRTRRPSTGVEMQHLWTASGGFCSFTGCPKRLVLNTNGTLTNVGIKAHIIGHKGPRYEFAQAYGYTDDMLEDVSNLMMMCYDHSKLIDDKHTRHHYPPDVLFEMKEKHEAWVESWAEDRKKGLAIIHKRLGPPLASLPQTDENTNAILEVLENQNEFTNFTPEGCLEAKRDNEALILLYKDKIKNEKYDIVEVYAMSPIPLLIHFGLLLSDTTPYSVFQFDRNAQLWVNKAPKEFVFEPLNPKVNLHNSKSEELVVTISISGTVTQEDIKKIAKDSDQLNITIDNPNTTRVLYREQVQEIQKLFKQYTEDQINRKSYKKIHLLYSGPAGLAIELGRSINPNMWPDVYLYQFNARTESRYHFAFSV